MDWQPCDSSAVTAYRHRDGVLDLVFTDADTYYSYPCSDLLFEDFLAAPSKGRFVNGVLKPHAAELGWTPTPRPRHA
ncbi:MAG TPA: hypothetical protein VNS09_20245 [Solirubrobacter sp.]|nr:hypothetical protein [Solirubrobacter sp.]